MTKTAKGRDICGSHRDVADDSSLLWCDAVSLGECLSTFREYCNVFILMVFFDDLFSPEVFVYHETLRFITLLTTSCYAPVLSHINPICTFPPCLFNINFSTVWYWKKKNTTLHKLEQFQAKSSIWVLPYWGHWKNVRSSWWWQHHWLPTSLLLLGSIPNSFVLYQPAQSASY